MDNLNNDKNIQEYDEENLKQHIKRIKQKFKQGLFLRNAPVQAYIHYLMVPNGEKEERKDEYNKKGINHKKELKDALYDELKQYLLSEKTSLSNMSAVEELLSASTAKGNNRNNAFLGDETPIKALFHVIQENEDEVKDVYRLQERIPYLFMPLWGRRLSCYWDYCRRGIITEYISEYGSDGQKQNFSERMFDSMIDEALHYIQEDCGGKDSVKSIQILYLFVEIFRGLILDIIFHASMNLTDNDWIILQPLLRKILYIRPDSKKTHTKTDENKENSNDDPFVAALKVNSLEKALLFFEGYCNYYLSIGYDQIGKYAESTISLADHDFLLPDLSKLQEDTDLRQTSDGIHNPVFGQAFKKDKLKEVSEFLNCDIGIMMRASDKSIVDITAAYNFLFKGRDILRRPSRTLRDGEYKNGYTDYNVQNYVKDWMFFSATLERKLKREGISKENAPKSIEEIINKSRNHGNRILDYKENLAAQRFFFAYKHKTEELLKLNTINRAVHDRDSDRYELMSEIDVVLANSILLYDTEETIRVCGRLAKRCMSIYLGLIRVNIRLNSYKNPFLCFDSDK